MKDTGKYFIGMGMGMHRIFAIRDYLTLLEHILKTFGTEQDESSLPMVAKRITDVNNKQTHFCPQGIRYHVWIS